MLREYDPRVLNFFKNNTIEKTFNGSFIVRDPKNTIAILLKPSGGIFEQVSFFSSVDTNGRRMVDTDTLYEMVDTLSLLGWKIPLQLIEQTDERNSIMDVKKLFKYLIDFELVLSDKEDTLWVYCRKSGDGLLRIQRLGTKEPLIEMFYDYNILIYIKEVFVDKMSYLTDNDEETLKKLSKMSIYEDEHHNIHVLNNKKNIRAVLIEEGSSFEVEFEVIPDDKDLLSEYANIDIRELFMMTDIFDSLGIKPVKH